MVFVAICREIAGNLHVHAIRCFGVALPLGSVSPRSVLPESAPFSGVGSGFLCLRLNISHSKIPFCLFMQRSFCWSPQRKTEWAAGYTVW